MKFVVYHACLPSTNKNLEKNDILNKFPVGVKSLGVDEVIIHNQSTLIPADVAMMIGWVHENSRETPHLIFRKNIIKQQLSTNKKVLLADSNLFLYRDISNPHHYLRYSFNGVFPNTGNYCDTDIDPQRWTKLSQKLNLTLKDYQTNGNHILLCLQRNGGWSMGGFEVIDWTTNIIKTLRQYTDRPIVIRAHPGDKGTKHYLSANNLNQKIGNIKNIRVSDEGTSLVSDLKNCWAVINHNSSPTVGAAIEGCPIFVTDPDHSQCKEIANLDLSMIETPMYPDRQLWLERLSMFHWNFDEIQNGECWAHMRRYV